jgi:hypothetical protein
MAQPQMARITCSQCNAWYNSERELRDHMHTAHRQAVAEQSWPLSSHQADSIEQDSTNSPLSQQRDGIDEPRE